MVAIKGNNLHVSSNVCVLEKESGKTNQSEMSEGKREEKRLLEVTQDVTQGHLCRGRGEVIMGK